MLKVTCGKCNQESVLNMHFYNPIIISAENPRNLQKAYAANVHGEAICPYCGFHIHGLYSCPITDETITELALRREIHV